MIISPDFPVNPQEVVDAFSAMDDRELCNEYLAIQACYAVLDNVEECTGWIDTFVLHFLDYFEGYAQQEISSRYCRRTVGIKVPNYPIV